MNGMGAPIFAAVPPTEGPGGGGAGEAIAKLLGFISGFEPTKSAPLLKPTPFALLWLGPTTLGGAVPNELWGLSGAVGLTDSAQALADPVALARIVNAQNTYWLSQGRWGDVANFMTRWDALNTDQLEFMLQLLQAEKKEGASVREEAIVALELLLLNRLLALEEQQANITAGIVAPVITTIIGGVVGSGGGANLAGRSPCHYPPDDNRGGGQ